VPVAMGEKRPLKRVRPQVRSESSQSQLTRGFRMRASVAVGSLLLTSITVAACRTVQGDPIPRELPGTYEYQATGRAFGHSWSFHATLELTRDGHYELITDSEIGSDKDHDVDRGRYIVRNGAVLLDDDDDGRIDEDNAHRLEIHGDSLRADVSWSASAAMRLAGLPKPILVRRDRIGD